MVKPKGPDKSKKGKDAVIPDAVDAPKEVDALADADEKRLEEHDEEAAEVLGSSATELAELSVGLPGAPKKAETTPEGPSSIEATQKTINDKIDSGAIEGIETISDLSSLNIDQLFQLESQYEGILFYAFTDFESGGKKVDFEKWDTFYRDPSAGERFKIDFHGNMEAYNKLGAADILPPSVRQISVLPQGDQSRAKTSTRRVGLKGRQDGDGSGFYGPHGYIPIFSGDVILIGKCKNKEYAKYRKEPTEKEKKHNKLGQLDHAKYEKDHGAKERMYMSRYSSSVSLDKGGALNADFKKRVGILDKNPYRKPLSQILDEIPDMHHYAAKYRSHYGERFGVDIPESILFSFLKRESGFGVDRMNTQNSGAGGMGQFIPKTWRSFLASNAGLEAVKRAEKDPVWSGVRRLDWRFNPELMIAATYWYMAKNMASVYKDRNQFMGCSRFAQSQFAKTGNMQEEDTWIAYLMHHDGLGGGKNMLRYQALRDQGVDEKIASNRLGLKGWQKWKIKGYRPLRFYEPKIWRTDEHWQKLTGSRSDKSRDYRAVLAGRTAPAESEGWGWAQPGDLGSPQTGIDPRMDNVVISANGRIEYEPASQENLYRFFHHPQSTIARGGVFEKKWLNTQMASLAAAGYTHVIDFSWKMSAAEQDAAETLGMDYTKLRVHTSSENWEKNIEIIQAIAQHIGNNDRVYIHCTHGAHRAPAMLAAGYIEQSNGSMPLLDAFELAGVEMNLCYGRNSAGKALFRQLIRFAEARNSEVDPSIYEFVKRKHGVDMQR